MSNRPMSDEDRKWFMDIATRETQRIAEFEADARRYRWLRDNLTTNVSHWFCTVGGEELNAAIDAEMAKENER